MLTRLVRIQLTIFTIVSVVGGLLMIFVYLQAPTLLGIGHITVRLELPAGGGLYRFANVTYRGVQVGKVTAVDLTPDRVASRGAQHLRGRGAVCGSAAAFWRCSLPARRIGDPAGEHHDSATGRADAEQGQCADQQHP
jgi:hypothetical protein